jgi:hypothetical protein
MTQNLDTDDSDQDLSPGDLRNRLEEALARAKEAEAKAQEKDTKIASFQKDQAFQKAGIPEDAEFFREHFDPAKVDYDPERIKAEAVKAKVLAEPAPATSQDELESHEAIGAAAAGGGGPGVQDPNAGALEEMAEIAKSNPAQASQRIAEFLAARGEPVDRGAVHQAPDGPFGGALPTS